MKSVYICVVVVVFAIMALVYNNAVRDEYISIGNGIEKTYDRESGVVCYKTITSLSCTKQE